MTVATGARHRGAAGAGGAAHPARARRRRRPPRWPGWRADRGPVRRAAGRRVGARAAASSGSCSPGRSPRCRSRRPSRPPTGRCPTRRRSTCGRASSSSCPTRCPRCSPTSSTARSPGRCSALMRELLGRRRRARRRHRAADRQRLRLLPLHRARACWRIAARLRPGLQRASPRRGPAERAGALAASRPTRGTCGSSSGWAARPLAEPDRRGAAGRRRRAAGRRHRVLHRGADDHPDRGVQRGDLHRFYDRLVRRARRSARADVPAGLRQRADPRREVAVRPRRRGRGRTPT